MLCYSTILLVLSIILLILAFSLSSKKESFRYRQQPKLTAGSFGKLVSQLQHNEDKPLINNLNI